MVSIDDNSPSEHASLWLFFDMTDQRDEVIYVCALG